jgi:hypothetical protein
MSSPTYTRGERHEIFQLAAQVFATGWRGDPLTIEYDEKKLTLEDACGLVWNCSDILPSSTVDELRGMLDMKSRTYAAALAR